MGRASEVLIPTRFLLTIGHFVALVLAAFQQDPAILAGLGPSPSLTEFNRAQSSLRAVLGLSLFCVSACLVSLLLGFTLFHDRLNVVHSVLHFFGGVLTAWYLVDLWGYASLWWIWAFFSFLPAACEGVALLGMFAMRLSTLT